MERAFVTGVAGFIGSGFCDRLLSLGCEVVGWDNFSTGQPQFMEAAEVFPNMRMISGDTLNLEKLSEAMAGCDVVKLSEAMAGCDVVIHLAANVDVRFGIEHPRKDLEQNTIATFNVLEAMRSNQIKKIAFSSTGSVYGEAAVIPTPEDARFPIQPLFMLLQRSRASR